MTRDNGFKAMISNNKKEIIILIILVILSLVAIIIENSYAINSSNNSNAKSDNLLNMTTSNNIFYINYDKESDVKIGSIVKVGDVIKYQAVYTNTTGSDVNAQISIKLSKGLKYVDKSSSIDSAEVVKNSDGTSLLIYNRTLLSNVSESLRFSCVVTDKADSKVSVSMVMKANEIVNSTAELVNNFSSFVITYEADGNGTVKEDSEKVSFGSSPKGVDVVPSDGYVFKGWSSDCVLKLTNGKKIDIGSIFSDSELKDIDVDKDLTIIANFESKSKKYKISYQDGDLVIVQPFYVNAGDSYELISLPKKDGFTPVGWQVGNMIYKEKETVEFTKNTVIKALYDKNSGTKKKYSVVYKAKDKTLKKEKIEEGNEILLESFDISKDCVARDWEVNGEKYVSGDTLVVNNDIILAANSYCVVGPMEIKTTTSDEKSNTNPISKTFSKVSEMRYSKLDGTIGLIKIFVLLIILGFVIVLLFVKKVIGKR